MQMKYRRIIFYIFLALFLISVPFILLYATGYRYNSKKNKFEKTGGLVVNTIIKNASLFVNGRAYGTGQEFRIQDLLPGEYEIKIRKSGYFDWQKKLSVESQITTFAKDVRLIADNLPAKAVDASAGLIYPAPDQSKFLYLKKEKDKNSIFVFDTANDAEKSIALLPPRQTIKNISWSPNNEKIILETPSGFQVINASDGKVQALPLKIKIFGLRWDETNSSQLFAAATDGVYKIDLLFGKAEKIYPTSPRLPTSLSELRGTSRGAGSPEKIADDFAVLGNYLYLVNQSMLQQINLNSGEVISLPLERNGYKIRLAEGKRLVMIDGKQHLQIFALPLQKLSTPEVFADAKNFDIFGNNLLYYNDFELWTHNFGSGEKELITRFGEEIKKARWLSGSNYVAVSFNNQIKIIELDKRDSRQIYDFPKFEQIGDFIVNKQSSLYFTGKVNAASGIYKLEL